jgi:hypothetical protein
MIKTIELLILLITTIFVLPLRAQDKHAPLSSLLSKYEEVKNALVAGDPAAAAKSAGEFNTAINAVDTKLLNTNEQAAFTNIRSKLHSNAANIAGTKDLAKQRSYFQSFSDAVITLIKAARLSRPVYIDYCPMKKASWASLEKTIRNPYYGSSMLTCGSLTETID